MAKSSELDTAYKSLSMNGARNALLFVMETLVKEAEDNLTGASPSSDKLPELVVRVQERRNLLALFKQEVK